MIQNHAAARSPRQFLRCRLRLILALAVLSAPPAHSSEPEPSSQLVSILQHPMLEADFFPSTLLPQSDAPDLLGLPLPTLRPLPNDPPDSPEPLIPEIAPADSTPDPLPLFVESSEIPEEEPLMAPIPPGAPPVGAEEPEPVPPMAPDARTFINPQLNPPTPLPPDILGVPNPLLNPLYNPLLGTSEQPAPLAPVRLARRYALELRAALSGIYDDSAVVAVNQKKPDLIFSLVPEVALTLGTDQSRAALRLAYAPALNWYTQGTTKDGVNQNVRLDSRYKTGKLLLRASFSAATAISGGSLDTGPTGESETYVSTLSALYQFTGRTSADFTLEDTALKYAGFNNSNELRFQGFGNYQLGKFKLGAGALLGLLDTETESSQRYVQPLGRLIYAYDRLTLTAIAGGEFRDLGEGNGQSTEPVFQIAASYALLTRTVISLNAQRQVFASVGSGGQNYVLTSFNGTIRQQFTGYGRNLFASLSGGVQSNEYSQAQGNGGQPGGEDDYFYVRLAFDWALRERCLLGGFYEYSEATAGRPGTLGFKRNRVGLQITVIFF